MKQFMKYFILVVLLGWSVGGDAQSDVEWVVEPTLDFFDASDFHNGFVRVIKNRKHAYINNLGKKITDFEFDETPRFKNGLAWVKKGDKWGCINKNGELIINYKFDKVLYSSGRIQN